MKMATVKLHLKILFLILVSCSVSLAQKSFFGANAGVNIAYQRTVNEMVDFLGVRHKFIVLTESAAKPTIGVFYQYGLSELFAVRLNVQYMGLGYKNVDINYLTLPFTFHYAASKYLSLNAGASISFTLGGTSLGGQEITKTFHKNDMAFSIGLEHNIYKSLALGVSYYIGSKNILLADTDSNGNSYNQTNRALQLTLIYKFKKPS